MTAKRYCHHLHSPPSRCPACRQMRKRRNKERALKGWETRRMMQQADPHREAGTAANAGTEKAPYKGLKEVADSGRSSADASLAGDLTLSDRSSHVNI